jgi:maltodextrin utilization protein YvdJ
MTDGHNDNRRWGVEDFERYHSGKMPEQEMYELEKAALDDPFLEDALEGYAFAKTPVEDIEALKNKLFAGQPKAKIFAIKNKFTQNILRIAAIFILLGGVGWLLYQTKESKPVEIAAVNTPKEKKDVIAETATHTSTPDAGNYPVTEKKEDNVFLKRTSPANPTNAATEVEDIKEEIAKAPAANSKNKADFKQGAAKEEESMREDRSTKKEVALSGKVSGVNVAPSNVITGRVVDNQGQPVANATIQDQTNNRNIATDKDGNFSLTNSQQANNVHVNVNAVGYETAQTALDPNSDDNKIVLQESDKALSEVVVTSAYQSKKNKAVRSSSQKIQPAQLYNNDKIFTLKNAQPVANEQKFNQTVNELYKSKIKTTAVGKVMLVFDIDSLGAAKNIVVKKSLTDSTNAAAIQILQNIPPLKKTKKDRKPEVEIIFL